MEVTEKNVLIKYPMKLDSVAKDHIWGGSSLKNYNKSAKGESWQLSINDDFCPTIANGEYKGKTFNELLKLYPDVLGKVSYEFPFTIKLIDTGKKGSTSMQFYDEKDTNSKVWYILDCAENSYINIGFKENIDKNKIKDYIKDGSIEDYINKIKVEKGKTYAINAGEIHSIGNNITLLEIHENNSNLIKSYDFKKFFKEEDRKSDVNIDKVIKAIHLSLTENSKLKQFKRYIFGKKVKVIAAKDSFTSFCVNNGFNFNFKQCSVINVLEGNGAAVTKGESLDIVKGDTIFIPANTPCRIIGIIDTVITVVEGNEE